MLEGWERKDRAAAISYALANAGRSNFEEGINDLAYTLVSEAPDDARSMILRLSPESAQSAVDKITDRTADVMLGVPRDYQKPPDLVARWMVTLPTDLWKEQIGAIISRWNSNDGDGLAEWLNGLDSSRHDLATAALCRATAPYYYKWAQDDRSRREIKDMLTLTLTIGDPTLRDSSLEQFAQGLKEEEDRRNVLGLIKELSIKPADKRYLSRIVTAKSK